MCTRSLGPGETLFILPEYDLQINGSKQLFAICILYMSYRVKRWEMFYVTY